MVHADDSVPFDYLLGKEYSGYYQAINASRDLKLMPSRLPKLFWGLSNEQRRLLAGRMLEAGHSGNELERAIRQAVWGNGSSRRRTRVPAGTQPWDNADNTEGGLNGIGVDGRPVAQERYQPREPFLVVEAEEPFTFGSGGRVEKPHERDQCAIARRRREIQENMRARVQEQEDYLAGLQLTRREWKRFRTQVVKNRVAASSQKMLRVRLNYGNEHLDGAGSETKPLDMAHEEKQREKQECARALKAARANRKLANVETARARRWEKDIVKIIRAETGNAVRTSSTVPAGSEHIGRIYSELARGLQLLGEETFAAHSHSPPTSTESAGVRQEALCAVAEKGEAIAGREFAAGRKTEKDPDEYAENTQAHGGEKDTARAGLGVEVVGASTSGSLLRAARGEVGQTELLERSALTNGTDSTVEEDTLKTIVEKLLLTSNSVALAAVRPLPIKPPLVLVVHEAPNRVNLHSRIRSRIQKFPPPSRSKSKSTRAFKGGGYRTTHYCGRGEKPESPSPCRASLHGASILDLDALSEAACRAGSPQNRIHPRNRFAPMADEEISRFLSLCSGDSTGSQERGLLPECVPGGNNVRVVGVSANGDGGNVRPLGPARSGIPAILDE